MTYTAKQKLKKTLLFGFFGLFLAGLLVFVSIIVYTVTLELRWDRFTMSLAEAVYLSNDEDVSLVRADYHGESVRVCTQNAKNLFNFIQNAKAGGFRMPDDARDELIISFGDGSVLHLYQMPDNGVYANLCRDGKEYGFLLGENGRFDQFVLITSLKSRIEGNIPWEDLQKSNG